MLAEERQKKILDYVNLNQKASMVELIDTIGVSKSTIRRDLIELEQRNLIARTHGGVVKKRFLARESTLVEKESQNVEKKRRIAELARRYVVDGDVIFVSGGTTTIEFARTLVGVSDVVVFTNAVNVAIELVAVPGIDVKLVGGTFRETTFSCVGIDALSVIKNYHFDKAFVGADGLSASAGITTPNENEAKIDAEVIRRTGQVFILADDSKFETVTYNVVCPVDSIDVVVTNDMPNSIIRESLEGLGIEIVYKHVEET